MSAGKKQRRKKKKSRCSRNAVKQESHIYTGCNYPFWHGPIRSRLSKSVNGTCSWLDRTNRKHGCWEADKTKSKHINASTNCSTVPIPVCCEELLFPLYWDHIDKKSQFHVLHSFLQKWVAKYKCALYFCLGFLATDDHGRNLIALYPAAPNKTDNRKTGSTCKGAQG